MSLVQRLLGAGATNGLALALGVATGVLTARGLGPHDRGVLIALLAWSALFATLTLIGLDESVIFHSRGSLGRALALRRQLVRPAFVQSVIGMLLTLAVAVALIRPTTLADAAAVCLPLLIVPLNAVSVLALAPLRAGELTRTWNLLRILPNVVYALALTALVATGSLTVVSGLTALVAGNALTAYFCARIVGRLARRAAVLDVDHGAARAYGARLTWAVLPQQLAPRIDQLLLPLLVSPAALGVYAVAAALASIVQALAITLEQVLFPRLVAERSSRRRLLGVVASVAAVAAVISVLLHLAAEPLIRVVYGVDYTGATVAVPVLLAAAVVRVVASGLSAAAKAAGALGALTVANWTGVGVTVALLPLAADDGLDAIALTSLAGAVAATTVLAAAVLWRPAQEVR